MGGGRNFKKSKGLVVCAGMAGVNMYLVIYSLTLRQMDWAFRNCSRSKSLPMPSYIVERAGTAYHKNKKITEVHCI